MIDIVAHTRDAETLAPYNDIPVAVLSYARLCQQVVDGQLMYYVWPDEGSVVNGKWKFNDEHSGFEHLLVDINSARLIVQSHGIVKPENAAKMVAHIEKGRGHFAQIVKLLWGNASFGSDKGPVKYAQ